MPRYQVTHETTDKGSDPLSYVVGPGVGHVLWMFPGAKAAAELCERAFQAGFDEAVDCMPRPGTQPELGQADSELCSCGNVGFWYGPDGWKCDVCLPRKQKDRAEPKPGETGFGLCRCGKPGSDRVNNGLACGCHCDECYDSMVSKCRSRSW